MLLPLLFLNNPTDTGIIVVGETSTLQRSQGQIEETGLTFLQKLQRRLGEDYE